MVTAIGANSGIITCGTFGSVMWWPEAELRSCVEAAGMSLSSEERNRAQKSDDSPHTAMSKVLRRYFTPSSAALAQATLQNMHSSGNLQGAVTGMDLISDMLQGSVDLDDGAQPKAQPNVPELGGASNRLGTSSGKCSVFGM